MRTATVIWPSRTNTERCNTYPGRLFRLSGSGSAGLAGLGPGVLQYAQAPAMGPG